MTRAVFSIVSEMVFMPRIVVVTDTSPVRASSLAFWLMRSASAAILATSVTAPASSETTWLARCDAPCSTSALRATASIEDVISSIVTDGSSQLVQALIAHDLVDELHLLLYPLTLGGGKRVLPEGVHTTFRLLTAKPYPSGVVGLHYARQR